MLAGMLGESYPLFAVELPGAADINRMKPPPNAPSLPPLMPESTLPPLPEAAMPEHAEQIHLTLKHVEIRGVTAFDPDELKGLYAGMLGQDTTLDKVWGIAGQITDYYRARGFFLSRAFMPAQTIAGGGVVIQVVEGYVGAVDIPEDLRDNGLVSESVAMVTSERPLSLMTLESVLLRLNDLPGVSLRSVLEPLEGVEGAAKLTLVHEDKRPDITVQTDNYGTRYLGPYQVTSSYHGALLPFEDTTFTGLSTLPMSEMRYGGIQQRIPLDFATDLTLSANHSISAPGYTLSNNNIRGDATEVSVGVNYSILRQRQKNLQLHMLLDGLDSATDLLGTKLARDRVRTLRIGAHFDYADHWNGVSMCDLTVSRGLATLGASNAHNPDPSRTGAIPDFTKAQATLSRLQQIDDGINLFASVMAQKTPDVLYSSEEIGYGGQTYGRAYDTSELTGNQGIMGMAELRYDGLEDVRGLHAQPYLFYDIGKVWNSAIGQPKSVSAASAGLGVRITSDWNVSADFTVAEPLTRPQAAPITGNGNSPRFLVKFTFNF